MPPLTGDTDCTVCGEARSHVDAEGVCAWCRVATALRAKVPVPYDRLERG